MRRVITAREQIQMLSPWHVAKLVVVKPPKSDSPWMDKHGWDQDRLNANALSHWDAASEQTKAEAPYWYPVVHDWADEMTSRNGWHPDKGYATIAAVSPLRRFDGNLQDAHNFFVHHPHAPQNIKKPPGPAAGQNLKRAQKVFEAPDDPDMIRAALWGKAGERGAKKITNFHDTIRDPEAGGAYNYDEQPVVIDSWMPRGILWAHGEEPNWPEELNKPIPIKKQNPLTKQWEVVGTRMPTARDIGIAAVSKAGGYERMANAIRYVAQQRNLPFAHVAQAGIWNKLGGTPNPDGDSVPDHPDGPLSNIQDPHALYRAIWSRQVKPDQLMVAAKRWVVDDDWDHIATPHDDIDLMVVHGELPDTDGPEAEMERQQRVLESAYRVLAYAERVARPTYPNNLPEGLRFERHPTRSNKVQAWTPLDVGDGTTKDYVIGELSWYPGHHSYEDPGEVAWIDVDPDFRNRGIATEMYDWAKKHVRPDLHHSEDLSDQGRAWTREMYDWPPEETG